jgi:hypothetical protein
MIYRLYICSVIAWFAPYMLLGQTTLFVRASGNDSNDGTSESTAKRTIAAAVAAANSEDIIDVGEGTFAGATISKSLLLQGANANNALERWSAPTIVNSPLMLSDGAPGVVVTIVGLQFGAVVPIGGRCPNANVTMYNCKFVGSKPLVTSQSGWAELFLTASTFEAKVDATKTGPAAATTALVLGDVGVTVVRENTFRDFTKSAIDVSGTGQILRLSYNEFANCNATKDQLHAAIRIDASGLEQEVTIENSLFTSCATSVSMSGTIAGKTIGVQRNSFRQTPAGSAAIRNLSPTSLDATCNAFNVPHKQKDKPLDAKLISESVRRLLSGAVAFIPTNLDATDTNGDSIGFEPDKERGCAATFTE